MVVHRAIKPCFSFFIKRPNKLLQAFGVALLAVAGSAQAALINASPGSVYTAAQDITASFDMSFSADIGDVTTSTSTSTPYATIDAMHGNVAGFNWYSFTIAGDISAPAALSTVVFDVDYGVVGKAKDPGNIELAIAIYDSLGDVITVNGKGKVPITYGQGGSESDKDAYIETTLLAGDYYIAVAKKGKGTKFENNWTIKGGGKSQLEIGDTYQLQVSASAIPVPAAVWLFASGLSLLGWFRRKV